MWRCAAVLGAVGQEHHRVAGVGLGVEGVVEDHLGLRAQVDLVGRDHLLGQDHLVGQARGHAPGLDGDRDGGVLAGEVDPDGGDHPVLGEAEGLREGVAPAGPPAPAPDGADHRHADDARRDALDDGLPADDGPVHHDALDTGDHEGIVDLEVGLGGIGPVGHLDDPVAVADVGRDDEGRGHPPGGVRADAGDDHPTVAADGDVRGVGHEVGAGHRDAGLAAAADVGRDLHRGLGRRGQGDQPASGRGLDLRGDVLLADHPALAWIQMDAPAATRQVEGERLEEQVPDLDHLRSSSSHGV